MNISATSAACPNPLQYAALDSTTSPVTQTAEVAVKSAVTNGAASRPAVAAGSISSPVPTAMSSANPPASESSALEAAGSVMRRRRRGARMRAGAVSRSRGRLTTRSPGRARQPFGLIAPPPMPCACGVLACAGMTKGGTGEASKRLGRDKSLGGSRSSSAKRREC